MYTNQILFCSRLLLVRLFAKPFIESVYTRKPTEEPLSQVFKSSITTI